MPFEFATATASFRSAELSEDRFAVHEVEGGAVVVVADGAGGIPGGAAAADLAVKSVVQAVDYGGTNVFDPAWLRELLVHVDVLVNSDREAGETTLVVVALCEGGGLYGVSVGDSGALVVARDGTVDDLTAGQQRKRRLGSGRALPVTFERKPLNGTLVVASDGLLGYARLEVVGRVVRGHEDLQTAAEALVVAVRLPSGDLQDDVAVVLVRRN